MTTPTDRDLLLIAIARADGQTWDPINPEKSGYSRTTAERMYGQIADAAERCLVSQWLTRINQLMDPWHDLRRAAATQSDTVHTDTVLAALTAPGAFGVKPGGAAGNVQQMRDPYGKDFA